MNKDILLVIILAVALGAAALYLKDGFTAASFNGGPYLSPNFKVVEPKPREVKKSGGFFNNRSSRNSVSLGEKMRQGENTIITKAKERSRLEQEKKKQEDEAKRKLALKNSEFKDKVFITAARAKETDPSKEYITIFVSNKLGNDSIEISGWRVQNSKGEDFTIGKGVYMAYSSKVSVEENIYLKRGEKAHIITGRSPIGISFLTNKCTGYFGQFQDFSPALKKDCVSPGKEEGFKNADLTDNCVNYIERLPACEVPLKQKPFNLDNSCLAYIDENINYNGCVLAHKQDNDFYKGVWMVYLNRNKDIYKQTNDTVNLYDASGKLVSSAAY